MNLKKKCHDYKIDHVLYLLAMNFERCLRQNFDIYYDVKLKKKQGRILQFRNNSKKICDWCSLQRNAMQV